MSNPGPGYRSHPEHRVDVEPFAGLVTAKAGGELLASSHSAFVVRESGYSPVYYLPPQDVRMERLRRCSEQTHCPFKGDACYYAVRGAQDPAVAWSYEQPFDEVSLLAGYIAFYPQRLDALVVLPDSHEGKGIG